MIATRPRTIGSVSIFASLALYGGPEQGFASNLSAVRSYQRRSHRDFICPVHGTLRWQRLVRDPQPLLRPQLVAKFLLKRATRHHTRLLTLSRSANDGAGAPEHYQGHDTMSAHGTRRTNLLCSYPY